LRGLRGCAGGEQGKDGNRGAGARLLIQNRSLERQPDVVRHRKLEALTHYANDRDVLVSELHGASEHVWIAA
jgi:hypothetical protein